MLNSFRPYLSKLRIWSCRSAASSCGQRTSTGPACLSPASEPPLGPSAKQITGGWIDAAVEDWVSFETSHRFSDGMFVANVQGRSMDPKIRDGSY